MATVPTPTKKNEYEKVKQATKTVFFFKDPEYGVDQKSKEIFTKEDKEIHYPLPFKGEDKYINIKKFIYIGFGGKLPVGVYKSFTWGYGFTGVLWPLIEYLNGLPIQEVVMEKGGTSRLDLTGGILHLSEAHLQMLNTAFTSLRTKQKEERNRALQNYLHSFFPKEISALAKSYTAGTLAAALLEWGNALEEFNETDKQAIKDLFDKLTVLPQFFSEANLARTKEIIDNKFIQAALAEFDVLMAVASDTKGLEKKWQTFLKTHSWIFSTLFSQPVILHQDEAYVGGKTLNNKDGKYNDFLIKSGLSNNVSFVEIKTHLTSIIDATPYRGSDVFAIAKDLTGCIGQVLNQRDNFQKEYYAITKKSNDVQTFNSKALVIIGNYAELSEAQKGAFELFRSNSKDVEILTFDELRAKINSLLKILIGKK